MPIKSYLPKSLFARALLILVLPVVLLQAVVAVLFVQRHFDGVTEQMSEAAARELNLVVAAVEDARDAADAQKRLDALGGLFDKRFTLEPDAAAPPPAAFRRFYDLTGGAIAETLKAEVKRPLTLDLVSDDKAIEARVLSDKGVLSVAIDRDQLNASNPHQLLVATALTTFGLVTVAVLFLRNQVRPIRQLAEAAAAFGKGRAIAFHPSGADEVRRAGAAFLAMRARIERQIDQRTRMLSGVSHDLRTPLTRMKLSLALLEGEPEADDMARDIREMERMLDGFLDFARAEAGEESELADPAALAAEVVEAARRAGARVSATAVVEDPEAALTPMRRETVRRALQNLVDNAAAWGSRVEVSTSVSASALEFAVEDDGPGIPPESRDAALKAFVRLDEARNQDRGGGVGLGLAIAADAARAHGGTLSLDEGPRLGGLRARMRLPR